jgi:hypothetical protein
MEQTKKLNIGKTIRFLSGSVLFSTGGWMLQDMDSHVSASKKWVNEKVGCDLVYNRPYNCPASLLSSFPSSGNTDGTLRSVCLPATRSEAYLISPSGPFTGIKAPYTRTEGSCPAQETYEWSEEEGRWVLKYSNLYNPVNTCQTYVSDIKGSTCYKA